MTEHELLCLVAALASKGLSPQQSAQKASQIIAAVQELQDRELIARVGEMDKRCSQ